MIELMNIGGSKQGTPPVTVENFFFFEGNTQPVIGIALGGAAAFETTPSIDGKSAIFTTDPDRITITFDTPVNLRDSDWTLEWSINNTAVPVADYAGELLFTPSNGATGLQARYGSPGFGNRLQFGGTMATLETCYSSLYTKGGLVGVLTRLALVQSNKNIFLFVNGVRQNFAVGTSNVYNVPYFQTGTDISAITKFMFGNTPVGGGAVRSKHGPIRLSMRARYTADYTPVPF